MTRKREIMSEISGYSDSNDPKSGIVSESRGYSDRIDPKKGDHVRIKGIFGQQWHEKVESCPNQGDIRTAMARKRGFVSELGAYSDSIYPEK
jgi:hypothetical protein